MSDNRKYYYLKLKENYFDNDSIVLLESMQDGVLYSNILLKLYLKSGNRHSQDSGHGSWRRSGGMGRHQPSGRLRVGQPRGKCSCYIEKHNKTGQGQSAPPLFRARQIIG